MTDQTEERVLRVVEFAERIFTTQPRRRIGRGHTTTIRRVYEVAKFLWDTNHRDRVTREDLENAIFYCVGADNRTMNRYIGRWLFTRPVMRDGLILEPARKIKYIKGYLERFKFIIRSGEGTWDLLWQVIPEQYLQEARLSQVNLGDTSGTITKMCVQRRGGNSSDIQQTTERLNTTTHNTHTNQLSESILATYVRPQKAKSSDLSAAEKAAVEERDRKRLEAIESLYLDSIKQRQQVSGAAGV